MYFIGEGDYCVVFIVFCQSGIFFIDVKVCWVDYDMGLCYVSFLLLVGRMLFCCCWLLDV